MNKNRGTQHADQTGALDVGDVARLSGVTVRTLHHYEQIGLLVPAARSASGYRRYADADLARLTRILYYRDLGFALNDIGELLAEAEESPAVLREHLDRQHRLLCERQDRTAAMIAAIEKEREALTMGTELTAAEKLEIFGSDYDPAWEAEAEERWSGTRAWAQSQQAAAGRSKDDWRRIKAAGDAWNARAVELFQAGVAADDPRSTALAEEHRAMVSEHYDCSYAMQRQLADMFVADARFAKTYNDLAAGLAQWVHDAIHANADQHPDAQGDGFQ